MKKMLIVLPLLIILITCGNLKTNENLIATPAATEEISGTNTDAVNITALPALEIAASCEQTTFGLKATISGHGTAITCVSAFGSALTAHTVAGDAINPHSEYGYDIRSNGKCSFGKIETREIIFLDEQGNSVNILELTKKLKNLQEENITLKTKMSELEKIIALK